MRKILFCLIIFIIVLFENLHAVTAGNWMDAFNDEQLQALFDQTNKKFEGEVKPQAIAVWDSKWFQLLLLEVMKREFGPMWYESYDPKTLQAIFKEGVEHAKALMANAELDPLMTTAAGAYFYSSKPYSLPILPGYPECGWTTDNVQILECIKISFLNIMVDHYYPMYKTAGIAYLVHEGVHAFCTQTEWCAFFESPGTYPFEYEGEQKSDHCFTWGTLLGSSTIKVNSCITTVYDIEEILTGLIYEAVYATASFPDAPFLPGKTVLNTSGMCQSDLLNASDMDTDGDGLSNNYENNSDPPTNPWIQDTDNDGFQSGKCNDDEDKFPTDPTECLDTDNDGVGNMHDACPLIDDCESDFVGETNDGQPFNKYCTVDKDRDGLCEHPISCPLGVTDPSCYVPVDPNDGSLDADGDKTPDYADENPAEPLEVHIKYGFYDFDIDDDGLCNKTEDFNGLTSKLDTWGRVICIGRPDPCPWKWDCDGDWVSDGLRIPIYIQNTISLKCSIDKDGDGLCGVNDPDDSKMDFDDDKVPDFADPEPAKWNENEVLKEGFNPVDIDRDGLCNEAKDFDITKKICSPGMEICCDETNTELPCDGSDFLCVPYSYDACPWKWDCDNDGKSDGPLPHNVSISNIANSVYDLQPGPDPYTLSAADILGTPEFNYSYIGSTTIMKLSILSVDNGKMIVPDLTGNGVAKEYALNFNPFLNVEIPEGCDFSVKDSLLDTDFDGLLNCVDEDIDNDGVPNAVDINPYNPDSDCDECADSQDKYPEDPTQNTCSGDPNDLDGDGIPDVEPKEICADKLDNNYDGKVDEGCLSCNSPEAGTSTYLKGDCDTVTMLVNADLLKKQCSSLIKGPPAEVIGCWEGCKAQYPCEDNNCELYDQQYGQQYYCGLDCTASWKEGCKKPCLNIIGDKDELQKCVYKCNEWNWEYLECAKTFQPLSYTEAAATLPMCYVDEADVTYVDEATGKSFVDHVCGVVCEKSIKGSENCDFDNDGLLNDEDDDPYHAFDSEGGVNPDYDSDGIANLIDNCMDVANTEQFDSDFDGTGDVCEETPQEGGSLPLFAEGEDSDGDGTPDGYDDAPSDPLVAHDIDGDGIDNEGEEDDIDGDGVYDWDEAATCVYCKYDPSDYKDDDGDGIGNNLESKLSSLKTGKSLSQETSDNDGDGIQDGYDTDKDGLSDGHEIVVLYDKKTGKVIYYQLFDPTMVDTDYNGLLDLVEYSNGCDMGIFKDDFWGDIDFDGQANCYDSDADGDFIFNKLELAGGLFAGIPNFQELFTTDPKLDDTDDDVVKDFEDNCPNIYNSDQKDTDSVPFYDKYALGDACDADDDDDGAPDEADCAPTIKWVAPAMPEYCNDKVDNNCNGQFDENCSGDYDGDGIIDSADDCPYIPSQKGDKKLCLEYPHFIPLYHIKIDDINNDGCMCAFSLNKEDCNPGMTHINGKCQIGPDFVLYQNLYHECCLICNFDNDCEGLKIWKAQYPEPVPEPQPEQPLAEPEQPPQPDQGAGGDSAGDDKPMLPAGKGPVPPSDRVVGAEPTPGVRPTSIQPAEEKPTDRLPAQLPPAPPIVDWDGDGIIPKDNCPCVPNSDQDPDSVLVKSCESMDYCENMTDYIEAKIACNGEDCSEKSCAPSMRCSMGKCVPNINFGWPIVKDLYHSCCGEDTDEVCKDGKIWIAQYPTNDVDGDGLPNKYEQDAPPIKKSDPTKADTDSDGINDKEDNCPNVYNPDQKSTHTELCSIGKVYAVPDHFDVPIKEGDIFTHIEVDETTYCMEWDGKFGEKICEGDKISLPKYCKHLHLAGDACGTDDDGDGMSDDIDCAPLDHNISQYSEEVCGNDIDDDCNGQIDENCN